MLTRVLWSWYTNVDLQQSAPRVRSIIEEFAKNQQMQNVMAKVQGSDQAAGKAAESKEAKEVKRSIRKGSEAFDKKDFKSAIDWFSKALSMKPSPKWQKWLYKNR